MRGYSSERPYDRGQLVYRVRASFGHDFTSTICTTIRLYIYPVMRPRWDYQLDSVLRVCHEASVGLYSKDSVLWVCHEASVGLSL